MTSRERVEAVLEGRKPDRVPVMHISFSARVASEILGRDAYVGGGSQQWRESIALWNGPAAHAEFLERSVNDAIDISLACEHDMIRSGYWRQDVKPSARIDEYTFRFEDTSGGWEVKQYDPPTELFNTIESSPSSSAEPTMADLERQVEEAEKRADQYTPTAENFFETATVLKRLGDKYAVRAPGPHTEIPADEAAWLEATLLRPDLVGRLLDTQVTRSFKNIKVLASLGGRAFFGGGDFASNHGPMYSPQVFKDLMVPRLRRISDFCHSLSCFHLFGTDGNVWPVADDLYGNSGIDGHYEFDRLAGMDIVKLHERFGHITMVGNIASFTLHVGSVEDVIAETRDCVEQAKATNKVIVGSSNIIISESPMKNVHAMLETIAKYR